MRNSGMLAGSTKRNLPGREEMKSMKRLLAMAAVVAMTAGAAWAQDPVGKWSGIVKAPGQDVPFILNVTKDAEGKLAATGESPSQAPGMVIPAENVVSDGANLSFEVSMAQGSYAGTWDETKKAWVGIWKQSGFDMPLEFTRAP
jgi:hypothetical protein